MINYQFTILAPWWHQVWFKILVSIIIMLCVSYIYINETLKKMALRRAYGEQQQSIKIERQRISGEIHDDIGAGIFAINLFADLANKKNGGVEEITKIKTMIDELSGKIREIIWTTNVENDNLENLLYFIQYQVSKLFEHTTITLTTELPENFPDVDITSQSRRNIYLIVKEIAHNALKHSEATTFEMIIKITETNLYFSFKDNGCGIDNKQTKTNSMGLKNLRLRMERLRGQLAIGGNNGTTVIAFIPLNEIVVESIIEKEKKLMSFFRNRRSNG
jgi:signal transduction histidine kinase